MSAQNSIHLTGRFVRDPEERQTRDGNTVARFSIAVDRSYKREGQPEADFFNCSAFGKRAEFIMKYFHKGMKAILEGEMHNNNYQDKKTGNMVYGFEVNVGDITFAESKKAQDANGTAPSQETLQQNRKQNTTASAPFDDDDFMNIPEDTGSEELPFGGSSGQDESSDDDLPFV